MSAAVPDPTLLDGPPRGRVDGATLLSIYLVLLYAVPSRLVVGPLGGAGTPAQLLALTMLLWWFWHHLHRISLGAPRDVHQPVRLALSVFLGCVALSYIVGMLRPIEPDELSSADLMMVALLAWAGTVLVANDGLTGRNRLETMIRRLAIAAGLLAGLGVLQFVTGVTFVEDLVVPGLSENARFAGTYSREDFTRPSGTAFHPIEYGAVLTMLLPFAMYHGLYGRSRRSFVRWLPAGALAMVIPLSLSRSAMLGTVVCIALIVPWWPRRARRVALAMTPLLLAVFFVAVPGLLGTIAGLFTGISDDSSAESRVAGVDNAWAFVTQAPFLGRGLGTFLPKYQILDNQLLLLLVEIGFVGLGSFLALTGTAIFVSVRIRRASVDARTKQLAQAFIASVTVGVLSFSLFDGFSFPMASGTLALVVGLAGGHYRVVCAETAALPGQQGVRTP